MKATTITLPPTFQGMCWHCVANVMFGSFRPTVERGGLRCSSCGSLNKYRWTEEEFRDTQQAYSMNSLHRILALDLATVCGHATHANGITTSGSQDFTRYTGCKSRPPEHPGASFAMFRRWLHEKLRQDKPGAIVYEEVRRWMSANAAHAFCGYRGIMLEAGCLFTLPCYGYSPTAIKKHWTGKGTADKPAMIAETRRRFPELDLTDDNEADALAILHLHLSTLKTHA